MIRSLRTNNNTRFEWGLRERARGWSWSCRGVHLTLTTKRSDSGPNRRYQNWLQIRAKPFCGLRPSHVVEPLAGRGTSCMKSVQYIALTSGCLTPSRTMRVIQTYRVQERYKMSTLKPWLYINNKRETPHANIWTFHSSTTWLIFIAHKDVLLCNIRQVAIMFWPTAVRTPLHHDPDVHGNVGTLFMFTHCIRVKHNMTWLFHEFTAEYKAVNKSTCQNRNFMPK